MRILSSAVAIFLVMDPLGNIPVFLSVLKDVEPKRHARVIFRESLVALATLTLFLFLGSLLLKILGISEKSLGIAGGIIIFLIAIKMIFPVKGGMFGDTVEGEPFIVPLAIPLLAGPSTLATVMLLNTHRPGQTLAHLAALILAWGCSTGILLLSGFFKRILGSRGLTACERLMGMILTLVAVQMFMDGITAFIRP